MPVVRATAGGGVHIPPGAYIVRCIETKEDVIENPQFGGGQIVRLSLEVQGKVDEAGNPIELDAIANLKLTPKSKLWEWASAFGKAPTVGTDFDTDSLVDCTAQAIVVDKVSGEGVTYSRVDNIVPMPSGMPAQPPSVINSDGSPNHTAFWTAVTSMGLTKKSVYEHVGGMEKLSEMDGADFASLLNELREAISK